MPRHEGLRSTLQRTTSLPPPQGLHAHCRYPHLTLHTSILTMNIFLHQYSIFCIFMHINILSTVLSQKLLGLASVV